MTEAAFWRDIGVQVRGMPKGASAGNETVEAAEHSRRPTAAASTDDSNSQAEQRCS
jgi:hypothetical protein